MGVGCTLAAMNINSSATRLVSVINEHKAIEVDLRKIINKAFGSMCRPNYSTRQ